MKISKSKQELARIISENGGWRGAANLALFGKVSGRCYMLKTDEWPEYDITIKGFYINARDVVSDFHASPFTNWHQTILSRAEYFHLYPAPDADGRIEWKGGKCPVDEDARIDIRMTGGTTHYDTDTDWGWNANSFKITHYRLHKPEQAKPDYCDSVTRSIPEPSDKPTIEQLAADYRNAKDYAERKQQEADDAKDDAEAKLAELVAAGNAIGLLVSPITAKQEPEPVAAKFTGKFHSAKHGDRPRDLDMICDGCGKRFGHHVGFDCRP